MAPATSASNPAPPPPAAPPAAVAPAVAPVGAPAERFRGMPPAAATPSEPERELWRGRFSPKAMYGTWLIAALLTVGAIVLAVFVPQPAVRMGAAIAIAAIWVLSLLLLAVRRLSVEYIVTNQRLLHQEGLLTRRSNRIVIIDIDDVSYEQGPFERIFNVGTIRILSSDVSDPKLMMRGIDHVQEVATLIDNARRDQRDKRAIYMETV
jgi:membrane protein YdbS with pleckstrin-like domain